MEPSTNYISEASDLNNCHRDVTAEPWDAMIKDSTSPWSDAALTQEIIPGAEHYRAATEIKLAETLQSSPFYQLPLEIRMMIYPLVIGKRDLVIHKPDGPCESLSKYKRQLEHRSKDSNGAATTGQYVQRLRDFKSPLAIAFTCRQIYHEAVEIWYGNIRFLFYSLPCMSVFLTDIGPTNRNAIRCVEYDRTWDILNNQTTNIKQSICTHLTGLRHLAIHWDYEWGTENQWSFREEDAHELLKLGDQLEVVVMTRTTVTEVLESYPAQKMGTVEFLELKRDKDSGRVVTTSLIRDARIEYRIPAGACGFDEEEDEESIHKKMAEQFQDEF